MSERAAGVGKVGVQGYSATPKIPALAAASQAGVALRGETEPHSCASARSGIRRGTPAKQKNHPEGWFIRLYKGYEKDIFVVP